jgi:hypothetical protein
MFFGFEDAFLYAVNMLLQRALGQLVPAFTLKIKRVLGLGCLRFCHTCHTSSFLITVPTSAYPVAFPLAFAS